MRLLILLFLLPLNVIASTWYVKGPLECANNGNGTAATCAASEGAAGAWDGFSNITWGSGGVVAGDTLFVCGLHDGSGANDYRIVPTVSGTDGNPITIDWNCSGDVGRIISAAGRFTTGWTGPDAFGAYSRSYGGATQFHLVEDTDAVQTSASLTRLAIQTKVPDGDWGAGEFFLTGGTLYYRPTTGVATDHIVYATWTTVIDIDNQSYITLNSPTIDGLASSDCIELTNADNIIINNPKLRWCRSRAIEVNSDSDNLQVLGDIDISESGNGIYLISNDDEFNNDNYIIRGNWADNIYDLDQDDYYGVNDNHAVGIQGGDGGLIEQIHMRSLAGSCVTYFSFPDQQMNNNILRYFKCHDVSNTGSVGDNNRFQLGVELGNENSGFDANDTTNNKVYGGLIYDIENKCIDTKAQKPTSGHSWSYTHITAYDCAISFEFDDFPDGDAGFVLADSIFDSPVTQHVSHNQNGTETLNTTDNIIFETNAWNPDGASEFEWDGTLSNYATWNTSATQVGGGIIDPKFIEAASGDFTPRNRSQIVDQASGNYDCLDARGPVCISPPDIGGVQTTINRFGLRICQELPDCF